MRKVVQSHATEFALLAVIAVISLFLSIATDRFFHSATRSIC